MNIMKAIRIILIIQIIFTACSHYTSQEEILGLWVMKNYDNSVISGTDTLKISLLSQKLNIEFLNANNNLKFEGVTFNENSLKYHISENDTTNYYEYQLSGNNREFTGGTTESWDGRAQEIKLIKFKEN